MEFELNNYRLRPGRESDAKALMELTNDPEVMKYYGSCGAYYKSETEALEEISWFNSLFEESGGRWVITTKESDDYIGDIGIFDFVQEHRRGEIGYKLHRDHWGKGVITEAIGVLCSWAFDTLDYNRIEALVELGNIGSKRVLMKNGFQLDGTLRGYEIEAGVPMDMEIYSLLKTDSRG